MFEDNRAGRVFLIQRQMPIRMGEMAMMPKRVQIKSTVRFRKRLYQRAKLLRKLKETIWPSIKLSVSRVANGMLPISGMKAIFLLSVEVGK